MIGQVSLLRRRKRLTVAALCGVVALMVGLVSVSVPLYRWFCEVTGYGGTTQRADAATGRVADRIITVRFSADVTPELPWRFRPEQPKVKVRPGEQRHSSRVGRARCEARRTALCGPLRRLPCVRPQ